jgi:hypothetical protein
MNKKIDALLLIYGKKTPPFWSDASFFFVRIIYYIMSLSHKQPVLVTPSHKLFWLFRAFFYPPFGDVAQKPVGKFCAYCHIEFIPLWCYTILEVGRSA